MPDNPISTPLPADLPVNWQTGQIVAPNGADVGLSAQHGYNYLMQQLNAAQQAVNTLGQAIAALTGEDIPTSGTDETTIAAALSNKVNLPISIPAAADLNEYTIPGMYFCDVDATAESVQNCPTTHAFSLFVEIGARSQVVQTLKTWNDGNGYKTTVYVRSKYPEWGAGWQKLATATPPQEYDLPLAEGVTKHESYDACGYTRDQFGQVIINLWVKTTGPLADGSTIATLPAGYRPSNNVVTPVKGAYTNGVAFFGNLITQDSDGRIVFWYSVGEPGRDETQVADSIVAPSIVFLAAMESV